MMNINKKYLLTLLLPLVFLSEASSQDVLTFKGDRMIIGESVSILEDTTNKSDFKSVRKSSGFIKSEIQTPNLPLGESSFWLRFSIKNESEQRHLLLSLEYALLDVCEFYYPVKGKYYVKKLSDNNKFHHRKYNHQDFIFDLDIPQDSVKTFYLKVQSSEQMVLPLVIGTPQKIAESKLINDLLWGSLVGVLIVMIFYNFFVFVSTRDVSYLYYVLYTLFIGLTQTSLSGFTYRFIFFESPQLFNYGLIVFPGLAGISLILFTKSFLHTREYTPKLDKIFTMVILLYTIAILLRLLGYDHVSYRMIDISALALTISIFTVASTLSFRGFKPAKLFLLAWSIFLIGLVLFVLRNLGILPYNNLTNYTMQAGTALEVTLLSLALADRINSLKKEKEASQAEALHAAKENERIIREQNVVLEEMVNERTSALKESNNELSLTLNDLKQAQSQLVESEKMASLGQLTAGIAHEINNPINFVTSNVAPLKRDVDILLEVIGTMEDLSISDVSVSDKQKRIEEYKEEIDYDYLKVEIAHLLKGINEGASRTAEIVKGLRVFSRLDEDDLKLADINEGLESTLVIANNLLDGIKVVKEYGELPLIECYPGKLNQVFLNIISNAVHAIKKRHNETEAGELIIKTSCDTDHVFIKISDNGTGMDERTIKKIFEPFFTTKDVGEGTGLGMSIAYNTVKKHNGHIILNSVLGTGTEFIIDLPISNKISET